MNWLLTNQRWKWALALVILSLMLTRIWCINFWRPAVIAGPSMAPALFGVHKRATCGDCDFGFPTSIADEQELVCPNCGAAAQPGKSRQRASRVYLDRFPLLFRPPHRWELVAFRDPLDKDLLAVKRVVGRVGEKVAIRQGDIWVNGEVATKSLAQLQSLAVLVHDDRFRPRSRARASRWQPDPNSSWQRTSLGWQFDDTESQQEQWLTYQHRACMATVSDFRRPMPVNDHYSVNQSVSRQTHFVRDLYVTFDLRLQTARGTLTVSIHDTLRRYRASWSLAEERVVIFEDNKRLATMTVPPFLGEVDFHLAVCDRRLLLKIGPQEFDPLKLPNTGSAAPNNRPVAIGVGGSALIEVRNIRLLRDLHYLNHLGEENWEFPPQSLVVLGDNVPVSVDSRYWELAPVDLVGKVTLP